MVVEKQRLRSQRVKTAKDEAQFDFDFLGCIQCSLLQKQQKFVSVAFEELTNVLEKPHNEVLLMSFAENKDLSSKLLENINKKITPLRIKNIKKERSYLVGTLSDNFSKKYKEFSKVITVSEFSFMIFDSIQALAYFNEKANLVNNFLISFKMFVFCQKVTIGELIMIAEANIEKREYNKGLDMTDILQFQYFVVEEIESIKLLTFVWYTKLESKTFTQNLI